MFFERTRGRLLFRVLGLHKCLQLIEGVGPEDPVVLEPGIHGLQGLGVEFVKAVAALAMLAHQVRPPQQTKVLGDGRPRDGKGLGDLSGRLAACAEQVENGAPRGIGKRVESSFRRICN